MSQLIPNIKIALENIVLCRGAHDARESYEYAERMEKMLRNMLRNELMEIVNDVDIKEKLCDFITKLERV